MASESTEYTLRVPERLCPNPALSYVGHCWDCALLGLCSLKKKDALNANLGPNQLEMEPTGGREVVKLAGRGVGSSCLVAHWAKSGWREGQESAPPTCSCGPAGSSDPRVPQQKNKSNPLAAHVRTSIQCAASAEA